MLPHRSRSGLCRLAATPLFALIAAVASAAVPEGYEVLTRLTSLNGPERRQASKEIVAAKDLSVVAGIVDALFFVPSRFRLDLYETLEKLTGEKRTRSYADWVEYVGAHTEVTPRPGYVTWKLSLFERIDSRYNRIFYPGAPAKIRVEEVVWGGVPLDGIPSLDSPVIIPAEKAGYLSDDEPVFGVSLGGEQRAYPVRHLSWHEMANDEVGGEPITLSYCTLCGSAILYSSRTPNGNRYVFGTSGLLYRSNKLMYDRQSLSLWSNLTGEPVIGRLANTNARLAQLPITRIRWGEWLRRFPKTTVLALDQPDGRAAGFRYLPGAADRARHGVRFPVWQKSDRLKRDTEVYALRLGDRPKAYPLELLYTRRVVNDRLGEERLDQRDEEGDDLR
ncbi:MAG TPA: DUF3179 domain-containing (seleno)protein, partial [Thermoanaerobaculia bacterium]|nr:DUF3179 domain-containing (seleno)protein [Thermoanaerobaculia bacterium]